MFLDALTRAVAHAAPARQASTFTRERGKSNRARVHALEQIKEHQPVVALLDIQLLDGPSFPVARALATAGIPFLFLSGDPAEFAGSPYLCKPVAVRDLMRTLEHV